MHELKTTKTNDINCDEIAEKLERISCAFNIHIHAVYPVAVVQLVGVESDVCSKNIWINFRNPNMAPSERNRFSRPCESECVRKEAHGTVESEQRHNEEEGKAQKISFALRFISFAAGLSGNVMKAEQKTERRNARYKYSCHLRF